MKELNSNWCFEGGCTFMNDLDLDSFGEEELDGDELEFMYKEPCLGMFD